MAVPRGAHTGVLFLAVLIFWFTIDTKQTDHRFPKFVRYKTTVPLKRWTSAANIAKSAHPVLLEHSPATMWRTASANLCDLSRFSSAVPILHGVRSVHSTRFVYEDFERLMSKHFSTMVEPPTWSVGDQPALEFFTRTSSLPWSYYSARLSHPSLQIVAALTAPREDFQINKSVGGEFLDSCNLWVGPPGSTAGFHYDPTHNFFAQICGRKRFLLAPPSALGMLNLYPFYHPRDRQSQREDIEEAAEARGIGGTGLPALDVWEAVVEPGQVLYLPPYWAHRVDVPEDTSSDLGGHGFSISVNHWSISFAQNVSDSLSEVQLPDLLLAQPTTNSRLACLVRALRSVAIHMAMVSEEDGISTSTAEVNFFFSLLQQRYLPRRDSYNCGDDETFSPSRCPRFGGLAAAETVRCAENFPSRMTAHLNQLLQSPLPRAQARGVLRVVAEDFVERLLAFVLSPPKVCAFLRCLGDKHGSERMIS